LPVSAVQRAWDAQRRGQDHHDPHAARSRPPDVREWNDPRRQPHGTRHLLHKVGALIESPAFYPQLSGRENLKALARPGQLPVSAVDPVLERVGLLIRSFAEDGITVLVSSHLISEIEQICDYVVMIRAGRLVHQGSVGELLLSTFLGLAVAASLFVILMFSQASVTCSANSATSRSP
jgi:ABC-type multidrug transport system ATPase subunit